MKRVTFINKYADSNDVARSTHKERMQINERNREYRGSKRNRKTEGKDEAFRSTSYDPITGGPPSHSGGQGVTARRTAKTNDVYITYPLSQRASNSTVPVGPGNATDPFDATSVPINSSVIRLLQYYKEVYYTSLWAKVYAVTNGRLNKDIIVRCSPEKVILECMESQSRMNSLLADIGCHLSNEVGIDPAINSLQLLQRGTASLRMEFMSKGSNVNGDILLDAVHLYLAAEALDQQAATRAHSAGVKAIITRMIEEGIPISTSRAFMLALVDPEISFQLLSQHLEGGVQSVED